MTTTGAERPTTGAGRPRSAGGRSRRPLLVAVSGPDGSGKSSLVARLRPLLGERGLTVVTTHCYGCFLCRGLPVPPRLGEPGEPGGGEWARRAGDPERRGSRLRRAHAFLDAGELAARIAAAGLLARTRARAHGRRAVVVTDRGPLDGLVKFDLPEGSRAASVYLRIARRYRLTLLVQTGPDTLRGRGWEEVAGSPTAWWARYRGWSRRLSRITRIDGERPPSLVAATALDRILEEARERELPHEESGRPARRHVVVSSYDDAENPAYRGGGALVVGKVARRLAEDYRVTVVTAGRSGGSEERDGVRYVRLPVGRAGPRAGQLLFLAMLPFVARRIPHDLWLESFTPPFSTSFLPLTTGAPVIGIDQGRSAEALWRRYHIPFFLVERLGLRCYRHIVVMNTADGAVVRRLSPRADVQVIANGVEPRALDETGLGSGQFILFLGRIDTWTKGLDLLLDAYERAAPPLDLLIAGRGTAAEERRLAALVDAHGHGPEPRIHWVGYAEEERKRQLLRDSAFLVMPSRHETFGLVALEGMSYGKPVLHFDLPALRWMRDGGDVAVPPFDVAALAERMGELATDAGLRRRLGRRSGLAARHYTWDEMTGRYLALAHRLLDTPAGPRRPRKRGASWQTTR
ncbi:glycosyltransferase [Streptomyces sp. SR27]|uniref:glycosyltransferase n=1 Tax=Streptomyces sp. SR27 TaxID=3076630 RepID=UPI00295AD6F8|nr:glycosyltransferase [Streptomyces sp. SR27]MDV9188802.1 glycosyltransferase [Streptomyces sp. SR27]